MKRIFVTGSLAYDRIMNFPGYFRDHFLPDKLHNISVSFSVTAPKRDFGGTAGNIAYNLHLLEEKPEVLATAGNDFDAYRTWMLQNGVDATGIETVEDTATATAYIVTDQGDNQITAYAEGADVRPYTKDIPQAPDAIAVVAPTGTEKMKQFGALFKARGIPYVFDPGQQIPSLSADTLRELIDGAEALFVNDYELQLIMAKTEWKEKDILEKTPLLIVTLGGAGSRILTTDAEERVLALKLGSVPDPTGAGDAFRAGFIKGRVHGLAPKECTELGSVIAAYAVENHGTQTYRFTLAEVKHRYQEAYGKELMVS